MAEYARSKAKSSSAIVRVIVWTLTRIALPLLLLYGLLWWRADAAIEKQLDRARAVLDVKRGVTVLGLDGDLGVRDVTIAAKEGSGLPDLVIRADRAVIRTPGLLWLVRTSLFGMPDEIPSRFGFKLDGATLDGSAAKVDEVLADGHVVFPFDFAGCDAQLSQAVLKELNADGAKTNVEVAMTHPGADLLSLQFSAEMPRLALTEGSLNFTLGGGSPGMRMVTSTIKDFTLSTTDLGFVAARNSYCQKRTGLDAAQFVARHVQATSDEFARGGVRPGAALSLAYAGFAKDGGKLSVIARPMRPTPVTAIGAMNAENFGTLFSASVQHNQGSVGPLTFLSVDPAARTATAGASTALPAAAAAPAPAASASLVGFGEQIPYAKLSGYVGQTVEVTTSIDSHRRGTLQAVNLMGVSLKVAKEEGGFALSIPKHTVLNVVRVAPTDSAAGAAMETK